MDSLAYDPQRFAMDYHIIGFRECASEVARYLINTEGMDIQDPLRMRLISHLQCFVAQRELSAKSGSPANWSHPPYQANYTPAYHQNYPSHISGGNGYIPNLNLPNLPPPTATPVPPSNLHHLSTSHTATATSATETSQSAAILSDHPQEQHGQDHQANSHHHHQHQQQQHYNNNPHDSIPDHQAPPSYTDLSNEIHRNTSASLGYGNPQYPSGGAQYGNANNGYNSNSSKPYRPWGAEMAY